MRDTTLTVSGHVNTVCYRENSRIVIKEGGSIGEIVPHSGDSGCTIVVAHGADLGQTNIPEGVEVQYQGNPRFYEKSKGRHLRT